jgi:dsDNA-binding SOS-regulon protein
MIKIEFVVMNSKGEEKMRTTDELAARAYDLMLDAAEKIIPIIESSGLTLTEQQTEDLAIHLVKHGEALTAAIAPAVKGVSVVKRARKKNVELEQE